MLDLNDIALFIQVVRCGSFAGAARRLAIPPNTVSRRIQQLEQQLGARLLLRSTRKLTLTSAGQAFHQRCAAAVDELAEAGQASMIGSDEPSGLMRVAVPADFFDFFPAAWVAEFMERYPRMRLDFVLSDAKADLIAEQIDVALRGGQPQELGYVSREILAASSNSLVASPDYLAAHGTPHTLHDLPGHRAISVAHPSGMANWRLVGPEGALMQEQQVQEQQVQVPCRFSANTAQAQRQATLAGLGVALLPAAVVARDLHAGRLVRVLPLYRSTGFGLHALYPTRQHLPPVVSAFIDLVRDKLNQALAP
ncbi:MAG: LysR family transcriptional regulator [Duganella sp.]